MLEIHVPRKKLWTPTYGRAQIVSPEGDILYEDPDWMPNALLNEGEELILNVFYREQANASKYLALLTAAPAETDTMAFLAANEIKALGTDGYPANRVNIASGDWAAPTLASGDYQTTATEKTIGPASSNPWTAITGVVLVTGQTGVLAGSGKMLNYIALANAQSVSVPNSFKYTLSVKAQ